MKLCPECRRENPTRANYCFDCGCSLATEMPDSDKRAVSKQNQAEGCQSMENKLQQVITDLQQRIASLEDVGKDKNNPPQEQPVTKTNTSEYLQLKELISKYEKENKNLRKEIEQLRLLIKNKGEEISDREKLQSLISKYEKDLDTYKKRNIDLEAKLKGFSVEKEAMNPEFEDTIVPQIQTEPKPQTISSISLYADAIINGAFHRISTEPDQNTVFEIFRKVNSDKIYFRIYKEAYRRVLRNPDFIDGCEKLIIYSQPQNLEVENGITERDQSGKWKIVQKAKVKFI